MCGIAGILHRCDDPALPTRVAAMTQTLYHRGPDDGGLVAFDSAGHTRDFPLGKPHDTPNLPPFPARIALGARRLSILDLSPRGHQPMRSSDGRVWIVFNGEIYNHVELRDELRAAGHAFASSTDTEVVLAAWQAWGMSCFHRFDGMWALAIYDPQTRELLLSRDRFGIKPMYYAPRSDGLAFASEIKALLILPDQPRRANLPRLADFLTDGLLDHTNETLFEGIFALPAGSAAHVLWSDSGEIDLRPEWFYSPADAPLDPPLSAAIAPRGTQDTAPQWRNGPAQLRDALDEEVRLHLRSDVPVGSCLSGGIDSSSIVATLAALRQPSGGSAPLWSQHTFTAVLPADSLDESAHARAAIADSPALHPHFVEPTAAGLLADLDRLLWHQDEPFGSPSIYMQWEVMKAARAAGVPVLLDGQGADELFCGYPGFIAPYIAARLRRLRFAEALNLWRSPAARGHGSRGSLARHVAAHLAPRALREAARTRLRATLHPYLTADLLAASPTAPPGAFETANAGHSKGFAHFWRDVLLRTSLPALLHFEDRNSMAFSIEARVPFLGNRVAEFAIACPASLKLAGGWTKAILRKAMRGRVPDSVLNRTDKLGFAAPTTTWMAGPLRAWGSDVLSNSRCRRRGWFRPERIGRLVERLDAGDDRAALTLWRMAIAEHWAVRMLDGTPPPARS